MKFPIPLISNTKIAPTVDLTLRAKRLVTPAVATPEAVPEVCKPCCARLTSDTYFGITPHALYPDTWLYPCSGTASFGMSVVADAELCGETDYEWILDLSGWTGGGLTIDSTDVDEQGHPRALISGSLSDCLATTNEALLYLNVKGQLFCSPIHIRPGCLSTPFYAVSGDGLGPSSTFGQPPSLTFLWDSEDVTVNVSVGGVCPEAVITWILDPSPCGIGYSTGTSVAVDDFVHFGWVTFLTDPCSFTIEAIVDGISLGVINVVSET